MQTIPMSPLTKEIFRKFFHLVGLPIIITYTWLDIVFGHRVAILALTGVLLLVLEFEYIRVDYQTRAGKIINTFFGELLRKHEKKNASGVFYFLLSMVISFSVYDYPIALLSLLYVVFGDLAASIMGIAFGKRKIFRNKSYIGTISGFIVNLLMGYFLLGTYPIIYVPMAITASFVEMLTRKLNDNLTVPLFSGFAGQAIVFLAKIGLPRLF